jgi:hypothetical protein
LTSFLNKIIPEPADSFHFYFFQGLGRDLPKYCKEKDKLGGAKYGLVPGMSLKIERSGSLKLTLAVPQCSVRSQRIIRALFARGMTGPQSRKLSGLSEGGYG